MRHLRTLVVCSLVAGAMALPAPPPAAASSVGHRVVAAVNQIRARHGLRALRPSPGLGRSSRRYAVWMLRHDYFGHLAMIAAPHTFHRVGETLGLHWGWGSSWRWVVRAWMHSAEHRRILLGRGYTRIGVSMARGYFSGRRATTWVAHLGQP